MHRAGHLLSDRKNGDRPTIYVERAAVCLAGGIQPATLQRCLTPEFFENGLAARLLVASPPRRTKKWTEADIDPTTSQELTAVHAGLLALRPTQDLDGGDEPADVALTVGAKALWVEFYNRHAIEQADMGGGELAAAWSKLEGYAARIALVVHCIRQAAGEAGVDPWHLTEQSMAAGIALAEWFGNEAKRVYAMLAESGEARAARELVELIRSMGGRATARDLCQRRRKYRSDAERARQDLQQLVDLGLGRWEHPAPSAQGGRPSEVFVLSQPGTSTAPPWAAPQPDVSETSPQSEVRGEDVYETARASPGDVGIADVDAVDDNADAGQQEGRI
jgi:hypothetical protein